MNSTEDAVVPDFALDLLNEIATKEGFSDFNITMAPGSNHADGFLGILTQITIKGQRNNKPGEMAFILKMPPSSKARREQFGSEAVFQREIFSYTNFLPTIRDFQLEHGLNGETGFFKYPKCYATILDQKKKRYALVLEDLKSSGYVMWNKFNPMDVEHVTLVLKELGKFHGVSFAIRDQRPEVFQEYEQMKDMFLTEMTNDATMYFKNMCFDRALSTLDPTDTETIEKLREIKDKYIDLMTECLHENGSKPFAVVNHGDCWTNNMMFSYNKENQLNSMCLIDWQILRIGSPVLDIVYFLFTSTHKQFRHDYYLNFLKIYHKSLSDTISQLGSDPEKLFTFEDLEDQLKKFGKFALLMCPMLLQIISADPNDIPDLDDVAERMIQPDGPGEIQLNLNEKRQNEYNIRMRDVIKDVFSYGYY